MYYKKGVDIMAFSIRLSEEEKRLADSYAKIHSLSLGEAFKRALFERIEDEYDIALADEAYSESKAVKRVHLLPNFGKSAVYEL